MKKAKRAQRASGPLAVPTGPMDPDPHMWIQGLNFRTTKDVPVPARLIDQVIGQDAAVQVAKKAAEQKRHLLLIGDPGTGKSMLAKAMTEILPPEQQKDILTYHNNKNPNNPGITQVDGGTGKQIVQKYERKARRVQSLLRILDVVVSGLMIAVGFVLTYLATDVGRWSWTRFRFLEWDISWSRNPEHIVFIMFLALALGYLYIQGNRRQRSEFLIPKMLVEHTNQPERAPYVDGTGAHAGALLGDVRHDPYQSGGLETPPHQRVEIGAIHRADNGVLFIDEINVLRLESQQALLTALQERKYPIVGQSQSSAGAMTRTEAVPCSFILVAAGNLDAVAPPDGRSSGMHPALRSRIRGYGYEVYVNTQMDDSAENRLKLVQFVAQEVVRDGKIPHFEPGAVAEIIREAQRRSGRQGKLTLRLRELGGVVRTAGDVAREEGADVVTLAHVRAAKGSSRSLEQQITDKEIEFALADSSAEKEGSIVGSANGVAIIGTGEVGEPAGLVVPIQAAVVPALSRYGGTVVLGHGLKDVRGSGIENVGAVLKQLKGAAIADHDLHIDAHIAHGNATAEGIGLAAAVACISALESVPVKQNHVFAGSIGVTGELRPARATLQRIEAAMKLGYKYAVVPESQRKTLLLDDYIAENITVVYAHSLRDALEAALDAPAATRRKITERMSPVAETNGSSGRKATILASAKGVTG